MKILYLDCYSGISGDMFLGALIDAGLSIDVVRRALAKTALRGYRLRAQKVRRGGIAATKFDVLVKVSAKGTARSLSSILSLINRSKLDKDIKDRAAKIFRSLAAAESLAHGEDSKDVHLHEVGDTDSIIDIVGAAVALKALKIDRVYSSKIDAGSGGVIKTRTGTLPVPAPAALQLLKGKPLACSDANKELVTPTGAALLANIADGFGFFPEMALEGVGYGAGSYELEDRPNCLRVMIGETNAPLGKDSVVVIETNIDDMPPLDYEYLMERLFEEGALDVFLTPVQMKKTRPGILLTVLSDKRDLDRLSKVIFRESTTIGLRYYEAQRKILKRSAGRLETKYGRIRVKVSSGPGGMKKVTPEYEDCKKIARARKIPLRKVWKEVMAGLR